MISVGLFVIFFLEGLGVFLGTNRTDRSDPVGSLCTWKRLLSSEPPTAVVRLKASEISEFNSNNGPTTDSEF
jgi:hypothetical protein